MASKKKATSSARSATKKRATRTKKTASKAATKKTAKKPATRGKAKSAAPSVPTGRVVVEREIGGRTLTLETGRMAKLSDGACVARYGDTMVLAAVNSSKAPDGIDFFPLTVDYREKTAAAGMIPGGFFKREGRPTTKEILACRIIDRSIRPMFPDGFKRDVQVLSQVLSADRENDPDVIAAVASFAALALSSLPHGRTLGMVRIGQIDGELIVNPTWTQVQSDENKLNLTVAGHDDAVVMVEAGAKEVDEEVIVEALELAHSVIRDIVDMVEELVEKAGKPKMEFDAPVVDEDIAEEIEEQFGKQLRAAPVTLGPKQVRNAAIKEARDAVKAAFPAPDGSTPAEAKAWESMVSGIANKMIKKAERDSILKKGKRADGRDTETVRPITIEVGVLPCTHGSVLFTRGETQALAVVTLGGADDQQIIDGLMPEPRKRFLLHYSFPPFSVGETKRMLAPGRREIGHGALAERGLEPVLPSREEFPYTIRVTSEILESNGSSSMATACGGTLAMMDAGVPIRQPVAGIAMGLVKEGKKYAILTDILGSEDACGDMDFKVVGTGRGITALQMDIKCDGLTREILSEALEQARQGRLHILREMLKTLKQPRKQLSPKAPRLVSLQLPPDKIGMVIGPGGKNIRHLQETYECKIAIEDSGLCTITGLDGEKVDACLEYLGSMTKEVELGATYKGRVMAIKEFGAFVEILPGQEGLVHVSELSNDFIKAVTDVVRIGDEVEVKVIAIDDFGKIKLSRKALLDGAPDGGEAGEAGEAGDEDRPRRSRRREGRDEAPRGDRGERRPRRARVEHDDEDEDLGDEREERRPRSRRARAERGGRPDRSERPARRVRKVSDDDFEPEDLDLDDEYEEERPARRRVRRGAAKREDRSERAEGRSRGSRRSSRDEEIEVWTDDEEAVPSRRRRPVAVEEDEDDRPRRTRRRRAEHAARPEREDDEERGGHRRRRGRVEEAGADPAPRGRGRRRDVEEEPEARGGRSRRRGVEEEPEVRGGRGRGRRRPEREMPMAEFDDDEPIRPFAEAADDVGELESIDSLLGEDEGGRSPRRRRGGRRPRRS